MTKKELMRRVVDDLPEDFEWEEAVGRLLYIIGIERGIEDVRAGRVISHEEMLKRVESWRK